MRNSKGFTLVELAVVLVIIGIILGAVIKGNDLIENAKVKGVIQAPTKWEVPIMTFYDKKGYFPGDPTTAAPTVKDGLITDFARLKEDLDSAQIAYPADTISDVLFDIKQLANACNSGATRNIMLMTSVPKATAQQLDTSIDGQEDATKGRIRFCGAAGTTAAVAWTDATATDPLAVVYFFDKTIP